ncbi:MAG: hypothetical protein ACPF9D_11055, partial [Owenweeksia sp.]
MTKEEIGAIRQYLSNNGIKYYDVQAELIDHFASAVEEQKRKDPSVPFKTALLKAHRSFGGRKGFDDYIDAAHQRVKKQILTILLKSLLSFLGWPLVAVTLVITGAWYFLLQYSAPGTYFWPYLLSFQVLALLIGVYNYIRLRNTPLLITRRVDMG